MTFYSLLFFLQSVLEGKTVIEYPTIFFGSYEDTEKLNMKVTEINGSEILNELSEAIVKNMNTDGDTINESSSSSLPLSRAEISYNSNGNDKKRTSDSLFYDNEISKKVKFHNSNEKESQKDKNHIIMIGEKQLLSVAVKEVEIEVEVEGSNVHQNNEHNIEDEQDEQKEESEEEEEEEEEEDDGEETFFQALQEFEGKDIEALQAFISSSEM